MELVLHTACSIDIKYSSLGLSSSELPSTVPTARVNTPLGPINYTNKASYSISGECSYPSILQVKLNGIYVGMANCFAGTVSEANGTWNLTADVSSIVDGNLSLTLSDSVSSSQLYSYQVLKDTVIPVADLNSVPPSANNLSLINSSVLIADVVSYAYKIGDSSSTDCADSSSYTSFIDVSISLSHSLSTVPDGDYKICLVGKDAAGNVQTYSSATTYIWTKDSAIPTAVLSDTPSLNTNLAGYDITVGGINIAGYSFKVGPSNATDCATSSGYSSEVLVTSKIAGTLISGDNTYKLCVVAKSSAGVWQNYVNATAFTWVLDQTSPLVFATVDDGTVYPTLSYSPVLSWSAATDVGGSGVQKYQISIGTSIEAANVLGWTDIGNLTSYQASGLTLTDGVKYYPSIRAVDNVGNVSSVISGDGWDALNPVALTVFPATVITKPGLKWKFSAAGGVSPYTYSLIGSNGIFDPATQIYTANATGGYTESIRVTDALNNTIDAAITVATAPVFKCGDVVDYTEESFGKFTDSGGSAGDYSNNENCYLEVYTVNPLTLHFNSFSIESPLTSDGLRIYDHNWNSTSLTGDTIPNDMTDTDGYFYLDFVSNSSVVKPGWEVSWSSSVPSFPTLFLGGAIPNKSYHLGYQVNQNLSVKGGIGPYTFTVVSGSAVISNVEPMAALLEVSSQLQTITVRVTDALGQISDRTVTVYQDPFTITGISASGRRKAGGYSAYISGTGILPGATATIGGNACTPTSTSNSNLTCTVPAGTDGCKDVVVMNADSSTTTLTNGFCYAYGAWTSMPTPSTASRRGFASVWTGDRWVIWGGQDPTCAYSTCLKSDGYIYNPLTDSWSSMAVAPIGGRNDSASIWTGHEVILFGGRAGSSQNTGAKYNPYTNTWASMASPGWTVRQLFSTAWTGNEMILYGGQFNVLHGTGAAYSPATNTWRTDMPLSTPRWYHRALWTGTQMLIFGGAIDNAWTQFSNTGSSYIPSSNTWVNMSTPNIGDKSYSTSASSIGNTYFLWLGDQAFVGGGDYRGTVVSANYAGSYIPETDTWTTHANFPNANYTSSIAWTGNLILLSSNSTHFAYDPTSQAVYYIESPPDNTQRPGLIWTGREALTCYGYRTISTGGTCQRFNLGILNNRLSVMNYDSWINVTNTSSPTARFDHTSLWSGKYMITWGGHNGTNHLNSGSKYDPFKDQWTSTSLTDAPSARSQHTALWAGSKMLVWGGETATNVNTNTGGIYGPRADTWTVIDTTNAPSARKNHSAIWTGGKMIVWGGEDNGVFLNDGKIYNLTTNTWANMSNVGAPSPRSRHRALWTGSKMFVWGGTDSGAYLNDGGLYDPATDTWTAISTISAPSARAEFAMVLANNKIVVWGGQDSLGNALGDGAIYDLVNQTWTAISAMNAPVARAQMSYVYTDRYLIVCGGKNGSTYYDDCHELDPLTNTWTTLAASGLSGRAQATAVWTGAVGDGRAQGALTYRNNLNGDTGRMIIWGGRDGTAAQSDGKIYNLINQ